MIDVTTLIDDPLEVIYEENGITVIYRNQMRGPRYIMHPFKKGEAAQPLEYNAQVSDYIPSEFAKAYFAANPDRTMSWIDGEPLMRVKDGVGWQKEGF